MTKNYICISAILLAMASMVSAQKVRVFEGEISDSQCAHNALPLARSHEQMLKSKSLEGTSYTCATYCMHHLGSYLVLVSGKDVYPVDRPDLVLSFEGQKVNLTGTLNAKTNRIHVYKISLDEKH